ncbi:phenylalanine--tRNA ligase subunit beta [Chthonomonas calidirosea]|uniref:phenylalanine--tRNA ligase subunit beta n=1 Tax=Chthonomonas calidirosea TaxID=454171 RepID=UPI0006EC72BA|nr:phenylalanine--tRNA ligase subunit beta [Chthonomonas calidirosea]CEK12915.1 phenylalanyl-tRNA synthetase beta subunit [Chthonomonas calidirosea]
MRAPLAWLQDFVEIKESAETLATRLTMGGLEVESVEREPTPESPLAPVLDLYVTPNRGDCLSMVGVAREIAALTDRPLTLPSIPSSQIGGEAAQQTSVRIEEPDLCPRYAARIVRGVRIGPSPKWMQERLRAAGQRPINNVVDVTNYVMLELGQPLHAFDLKKLHGECIVVRRARAGETITTLDGEERVLSPDILVIADADRPVAVAGVMGGANSEVGDATTDILLESAHFHSLAVRRACRQLNLRTEASYRFERIVDPNGVIRALDRACQLLAQIGQPEAVPGVVDIYPRPIQPLRLDLRVARAARLLGVPVSAQTCLDCLRRLGLTVTLQDEAEKLLVEVPTFRPDLKLEEDLIEEVGRIHGYEAIPERLPVGTTTLGGDSEEHKLLRRIRTVLVGCGLQEVMNHSLSGPSPLDELHDEARRVRVRNALSSEVSLLRRSLLPLLVETVRRNLARGQSNLALFEIGRVWQWEETADGAMEPKEYVRVGGVLYGALCSPDWTNHGKPEPADFYLLRGIVEQLLKALRIDHAAFIPLEQPERFPEFHPRHTALVRLTDEAFDDGILGELHPHYAVALDLRERLYLFELSVEALQAALPKEDKPYRPPSRFPAVTRDLAPRIPPDVLYKQVDEALKTLQLPILEAVRLIDFYTGEPLPEGWKSLTLSFTFRSETGTLTEDEVNTEVERIRHVLEERCGAVFPA